MNKIISLNQAKKISQKIKEQQKTLVLTGGCFDILHIGHIRLLEKSKKQGNFLIVLIENDKNVKKLKGEGRPINSQSERAEVLSSLSCVDYLYLLPEMKSNADYDTLLQEIQPDIITNTKNDPQDVHIERQAKLINAKVVHVIQRVKNKSTTRLANIIIENYK